MDASRASPHRRPERNLLDLDADQRDMLSVGLTARERVLHVKPSQSRDQMAGSVIGRWCLQRIVTQAQYDAAMAFLESNTRNLLAIDAPLSPVLWTSTARMADQSDWRTLRSSANGALPTKQP